MGKKGFGVLGLGISGGALLDFLSKRGEKIYAIDDQKKESIEKKIDLSRYRDVDFFLGGDKEIPFEDIDALIISPGIPFEHPVVKEALERKIEVIGEIEFAYRNKKGGYVIAVTGTNGKTTTTSMIGEILNRAGKNVVVAGNVGRPFISVVDRDYDFIVLEVSSFQLEGISSFRPDMALFLNISLDHLDRHKDMESYFDAKKRIFENQRSGDISILGQDSQILVKLKDELPTRVYLFGMEKRYKKTSAYLIGDEIHISNGERDFIIDKNELKNRSMPFVLNVMAASLSTFLLGISEDIIRESLRGFSPLPHRMEDVGELEGVHFINDSKATNPDAVLSALSTFEKKNVILIMGGQDKALSFEGLKDEINKKVKLLILMGQAKNKIAKEVGYDNIYFATCMGDAVYTAYERSHKGDIVLLSPGCTSWDMYSNYRARGDDFKRWVEKIRNDKRERA